MHPLCRVEECPLFRGSHAQYKWRFSLGEGIVYYRADVHNSRVSVKMGSTVLSGQYKVTLYSPHLQEQR